MKTYNQQALLYDDNCPLCVAYTKAFVKLGMLKAGNRIPFSTIDIKQFPLDINRARHEIPLVNLQTGEVKYGIDALAEILNQKIPFIKPVLSISWVHWFFKKLYSFISYNRKMIVAKPSYSKSCFDCSPDYSFRHRICLAIFTWVLSIYLMPQVLANYFSSFHSTWFLLCIIPPALLLSYKSKQKAADILVHSGITMLLSVIFLEFSLIIFSWLFTSSVHVIAASMFVTCLVFMHQLIRRIRFHQNECIS